MGQTLESDSAGDLLLRRGVQLPWFSFWALFPDVGLLSPSVWLWLDWSVLRARDSHYCTIGRGGVRQSLSGWPPENLKVISKWKNLRWWPPENLKVRLKWWNLRWWPSENLKVISKWWNLRRWPSENLKVISKWWNLRWWRAPFFDRKDPWFTLTLQSLLFPPVLLWSLCIILLLNFYWNNRIT